MALTTSTTLPPKRLDTLDPSNLLGGVSTLSEGPRFDKIRGNSEGWCLHLGHHGEDVVALKAQLAASGYDVSPGNVIDAKTDAAIRDFQTKNGLVADGKVGVLTLGKLDALKANPELPSAAAQSQALETTGAERALAPTTRGPQPGGFYVNPATGQVVQVQSRTATRDAAMAADHQERLDATGSTRAGVGVGAMPQLERTGRGTAKAAVEPQPVEPQATWADTAAQDTAARAKLNTALEKNGVPAMGERETWGDYRARVEKHGGFGAVADRVAREAQSVDNHALAERLNPELAKKALPTMRDGESYADYRARAEKHGGFGPAADEVVNRLKGADDGALRAKLNPELQAQALPTMREGESFAEYRARAEKHGGFGASADRVLNRVDPGAATPSLPDTAALNAPAPAPGAPTPATTTPPGPLAKAATATKGVLDGALHANFSPGVSAALHTGGQVLVLGGAVMDGASIIGAGISDAERGDGKHTEVIKTSSKVAGGWLGAIGASAATGAALGTFAPGLGNVAGFVVGAVVGGVGYAVGSEAGQAVGEAITQ
jgi:peptidoglycan hydrolase-like protein with peptidoglycan-binding domain